MARMIPLRGLRYTPAAGALDDLLAPPYDVISPEEQAELGRRSSYNAVHLELAEGGDDRYQRVASLLDNWQSNGILSRDEAPMFYIYEQEFEELGTAHRRRALLCGVEAQPWDEGAVKPHEFTMSGPKEDRLKLLKATRTQFSPVFMIARDRAGQLAQFLAQVIGEREPDATATTIDGDRHRLWVVEAGRMELRFLAPLLPESFYIADGHHRYETSVTYRDEAAALQPLPPDHPARFPLTAIVPAGDPGLVIRPIHRLVPRPLPDDWQEQLANTFEMERVDLPSTETASRLDALLADNPDAIIALAGDGSDAYLLRLRSRSEVEQLAPSGRSDAWISCQPNLLRYGALEPLWGIDDDALQAGVVEYTHETPRVVDWVRAEPGRTAFLIHRVSQQEVMDIADLGERLPQKSTFFFPKLGTGLVFAPLYP